MALERLSGPHQVASGRADVALYWFSPYEVVWVDPRGLVAQDAFNLWLIQMDGTAFPISTDQSGSFGLQLLNAAPTNAYVGDPWYSYKNFSSGNPVTEYTMDRVTLIRNAALRSNAPGSLSHYVRVHDRYLSAAGGSVRGWAFGNPAATNGVTEATITGMSSGLWWSWARERGHLWLGGSTGRIVRYDYINKVASSPVYRVGLASVEALFYSKKHDVFVSMHRSGSTSHMSVWARTPLPASVSIPTASPAVAAGRAVTLKTRVRDSEGVPCPNEVVSWSVTGEGALQAATSETDEDGYATNRLVVPLTAVGPSVQVGVEVAVP